MVIKIAPSELNLPDISKHLRAPHPLWRPFGWGSAATIALAAVAFTSQTEAGSQRLQLALAYVSEPVRAVAQIPPRSAESEAETRRLAAELRELVADRAQLSARIASLERNLDDMTGSIKQRAAAAATAPAADSPPPAPSAPAATPAVVAAASPAPALAALTPLAMPAIGEATASWPAPPSPKLAEPAPEPVPLPPVRMAAVSANEALAALPHYAEYGIDLGGAASIEALRMHWAAMKADYGPLLMGLRPVASPRLRRPAGVDYRLVAGPLPNIAAAALLCARFPVTRTGCRPAKFDGAHLAEH